MTGTDVLFVYTNINGFHSDTYSFGIGYLSSVLKKSGFTTALVVVNSKKDYEDVRKAVLKHRPKIIGFTAVSSQFVFISDLARIAKEAHDCITVCGGVHPTIFPDCIYSAPGLDGIFRGECEDSFLDFVSAAVGGKDYKAADNFCYLDNGALVKNKLRPRAGNIEALPFPDRDIYDYQSIIDKTGGTATIMSSRGCPFRCTYCCNHAIARVYGQESNAIRYNSVENTISEIEELESKYKFSRLWFIDDLFVLNRVWLDGLLSEYKKRFAIPFMCHIRPNVCTREMMFKLKDAGCYRVFIAVESANDHIRNTVMRRGLTKEQIENSFKWAKEAGIETLSVNIIGVPGETEETVFETIEFNKRMNPTIVGVNIFNPYEGTELGDYCKQNGLIVEVDARGYYDRKESRLKLPGITGRRLVELSNDFQYLVYKDADPAKAARILRAERFKRLEDNRYAGPLFRNIRKMKHWAGAELRKRGVRK